MGRGLVFDRRRHVRERQPPAGELGGRYRDVE